MRVLAWLSFCCCCAMLHAPCPSCGGYSARSARSPGADGVISAYEMEYFYEEQDKRLVAQDNEAVKFSDILTQMSASRDSARRGERGRAAEARVTKGQSIREGVGGGGGA